MKRRRAFKKIRDHRNKMVHFYHPDYSPTHVEVVFEQWSAWYYLHDLICKSWWEQFQDFNKEIEDLHEKIHGNRKYLQAKYDEIKPEIEREIRKGIKFNTCKLCGYFSARHEDQYDLVYSDICQVCHYQDNTIHVECPECGTEILIEELSQGECSKCGFETDFEFLLSELGPIEDHREDSKVAYCGECGHPEPSAIPVGQDEHEQYLCLNCNMLHDQFGVCHYCGVLNAGIDLEASYYNGCSICGGSSGRY